MGATPGYADELVTMAPHGAAIAHSTSLTELVENGTGVSPGGRMDRTTYKGRVAQQASCPSSVRRVSATRPRTRSIDDETLSYPLTTLKSSELDQTIASS